MWYLWPAFAMKSTRISTSLFFWLLKRRYWASCNPFFFSFSPESFAHFFFDRAPILFHYSHDQLERCGPERKLSGALHASESSVGLTLSLALFSTCWFSPWSLQNDMGKGSRNKHKKLSELRSYWNSCRVYIRLNDNCDASTVYFQVNPGWNFLSAKSNNENHTITLFTR